jgi:hypothetical protein
MIFARKKNPGFDDGNLLLGQIECKAENKDH